LKNFGNYGPLRHTKTTFGRLNLNPEWIPSDELGNTQLERYLFEDDEGEPGGGGGGIEEDPTEATAPGQVAQAAAAPTTQVAAAPTVTAAAAAALDHQTTGENQPPPISGPLPKIKINLRRLREQAAVDTLG
jgi:hypothetical protein